MNKVLAIISITCLVLLNGVAYSAPVDSPSIGIIGSGPAALAAANVIAEQGFHVVIFEGSNPGGPLNSKTPVGNWPGLRFSSGDKIIHTMQNQLSRKSVSFIPDTIIAVHHKPNENNRFVLIGKTGTRYSFSHVIVATGTTEKLIGVKGEAEYHLKGVVYQQKPDYSPFDKPKTAIVIGGGIDAARKTIYRTKEGVKVHLIIRGDTFKISPSRMRAIKDLEKKGLISTHYNTTVNEIHGNGNRVTHVSLSNNNKIKVDEIVVAIGRAPRVDFLANLGIKTDKSGFLIVDNSQRLSIEGLYAAGDVANPGYGEGAIAAASGMKAGMDILEDLT